MATTQNYRDQQLEATDPRLILVPSNYISLSGTGNTFEVRGSNTQPSAITIVAVPQGHIINQTVDFSLVATTGHTLSVSGNTATITGSVDGSDICTLRATISYQGLDYEATYTINKLVAATENYTGYEVNTSSSSLSYDPATSTYSPTSVFINSIVYTSSSPTLGTAYSGRYTIHTSTDGGLSWGSAKYTSSSNESSYTYNLTGVTTSTTHIRFRLHKSSETPSDSNVLDINTIPLIQFGYTGSGGGGFHGRSVQLDTGGASLVSVYDVNGYLASNYNSQQTPVTITATPFGVTGTAYYTWSLDNVTFSSPGNTNNIITYYRASQSSAMPDTIRVVLGDGYSGSAEYGADYVTFVPSTSGGGIVTALSNNFHTISFNVSNVGDYTNSGTDFYVYEGSTKLTFNQVSNSYPSSTSVGKYNVSISYTNISSGGTVTGTNTTVGTIPDHTNLTADQGLVTVTFRIIKLDGTPATEQNQFQFINKTTVPGAGVIGSGYIASGAIGVSTTYNGSAFNKLVDFTDLKQTFWPGDSYYKITSNAMEFGRRFAGQLDSVVAKSDNGYTGSGLYGKLTGTPSNPLTVFDYTGSKYVIGVACDPMDHPVLFGKEV